MTIPLHDHETDVDDDLLVDRVYADLLERIVSGSLAPGERLREVHLATLLNASRIPVREALRRLEFDGLVEIRPRRGATVRQLTIADVEELFDVREALEVLVARLAARHISEYGIARLDEALARSEEAHQSGDERRIAAASADFHEVMLELTGSSLLRSLMRMVSGRVHWLFRLTTFRGDHGHRAEHEALLDAIRNGDEEIAAALAYAHVARGRRPTLEALASTLDR
ncbi:GntR family transcriptional regulator [Nocardioides albidus]|uniref:GntR family transcriptional regulator n=1 Tax=Nocardioides albidus TaxID=1517589 RepID=A0A5C4WS17_9ACTN|nr:GntR family transcriptional regulator [Nocardioides albidus]TNM50199.1 GntR family transcriptional regulator [Nocardioides albidus]